MGNNKIKIFCIIVLVASFVGLFLTIKYCLIQEDGLLAALNSTKLRGIVQYSSTKFLPRFEEDTRGFLEKNKDLSGNKVEKQILNYLKFDGCWLAKIQNNGSLACAGVSIRLPYSEIFVIKRDGLEPGISISKNTVNIGKLSPLEEVMVYGWTTGHREITFKDKDGVRLTYDGGIGRVVLKLPLAHYWYYFSKYWAFLLFLWTIILCVLVVYLFVRYKEQDDFPNFRNRPHLM